MTTTGKRGGPETTSATPKTKQYRPQLSLPEISDLIQQNMTDPEEMQRLMDYGASLVEAARKSMVSSTVCTICKKRGGGSMKSRSKCKCRLFTVCEECEIEGKLEDTDVMECEDCKNLVCDTNKGDCERHSCDVCGKALCKDCMTKTKCGFTTLCVDCSDDYTCEDCDICMGYWS